MLGVRIDGKLESELERCVKETGRSKSDLVKQAVGEFLQKLRWQKWHDKRTLSGWQEIQSGQGVPADEVFAYLDSWKTPEA